MREVKTIFGHTSKQPLTESDRMMLNLLKSKFKSKRKSSILVICGKSSKELNKIWLAVLIRAVFLFVLYMAYSRPTHLTIYNQNQGQMDIWRGHSFAVKLMHSKDIIIFSNDQIITLQPCMWRKKFQIVNFY